MENSVSNEKAQNSKIVFARVQNTLTKSTSHKRRYELLLKKIRQIPY